MRRVLASGRFRQVPALRLLVVERSRAAYALDSRAGAIVHVMTHHNELLPRR